METVIRLPEVMRLTGLGKSSIYDAMRTGDFPKSLKLTKRAIGWRADDVRRWIESRTSTGA